MALKLIFKPNGSSTSADTDVYNFEGIRYNVTGTFESYSNVSNVRVSPAVTWIDDEGEEILLTLNNIYCDLNVGG